MNSDIDPVIKKHVQILSNIEYVIYNYYIKYMLCDDHE